jgi:hypothetical protein
MDKTGDYPYIRAWGEMLGSSDAYITEQVEQARRDKAPANATYRDRNAGRWSTTDDISSQGTRAQLDLPPIEPTAPPVLQKYGAVIRGTRSDDARDITFPSLFAAADWAREYRVGTRAQVRPDTVLIGFASPVTVVLRAASQGE